MIRALDDFNRADNPDLGNLSGGTYSWVETNWEVKDNMALSSAAAANHLAVLDPNPDAQDVYVQTDSVQRIGDTSRIVARYANDNNFYVLTIKAGDATYSLDKMVGGVFTNLGTYEIPGYDDNTTYTMRLECDDIDPGSISGYLDGTLRIGPVNGDNGLDSGNVGYRNRKDSYHDNFDAGDLGATTTTTTQAPTTQAPTTTTQAPTTQAPTTTTEAPTTEAPTTTSEAPTTEAPTTTTQAPTTEAPTTEAPTTTTEAPTTEAPTTTTEAPTTEAPTTTTEAPTTPPAGTTTSPEASTTTTTAGEGLVVRINGEVNTDLCCRSVSASYVQPWRCELYWDGRHDDCPRARLWDDVLVTWNSTPIFRGNVTSSQPGGVAREGVLYTAQCKRFRLENEPVRINGRGHYIWNRRGHTCDEGQGGEDSPGADGGKWEAGEIVIDILEHALGLPVGGSDIPGHHSDASCITATYLTADDIAGYDAATILTLDSIVGEFSVDDTPVADAISMLLALNGGFWGWYLDPDTGNLIVQDLDTLAVVDVQAGELGHWQDEAGTDYRLLENELTWSLDGVCSIIAIQGTDRLSEEQPANIEGTANPGAGNLGELEQVAAPWKGYNAAYRAVAQPTRQFTTRPIDDGGAYTPPFPYGGYPRLPRIYQGTDAGAKYVYRPSSGVHPMWLVPSRVIGFWEVPALGPGEKLWGWYWAETPFVVTAGPRGDAWCNYGYERTRTVYDNAFKHTTSYPQPGTADDETAMEVLADRLLRLYQDVRRQGRLLVDVADPENYDLDQRLSVVNLGLCPTSSSTTEGPTTTPSGTTTTEAPCADPTAWDTLQVNAVEVTWSFEGNVTEITVANTFFMLEEYSELKRRLEMNLFARRELDLSEDLYACQVQDTASQVDEDDIAPTTSTTSYPTDNSCCECPDTIWITLSGGECDPHCNGVYELTQGPLDWMTSTTTPGGCWCIWSNDEKPDCQVAVYASGNHWYLDLYDHTDSLVCQWRGNNINDCPPHTGWKLIDSESEDCCGAAQVVCTYCEDGVIGAADDDEEAQTDQWTIMDGCIEAIMHFRTGAGEDFYRPVTICKSTDAAGNPIGVVNAIGPEVEPDCEVPDDCTDNTIGTIAETEAAQTDSWDWCDGCVKDTRQVRTAYGDAGDEKLYAYYRDYYYTASGRLYKVTAETRVTIETPEPC